MQNDDAIRGSKVATRISGAVEQAPSKQSMLNDDVQWRIAVDLVQRMREAGYECELIGFIGRNTH